MKKFVVGVSVCLVALTAGLVTQASSRARYDENLADLDIPARYIPSQDEVGTDEEFRTVREKETTIAIPEEEPGFLDVVKGLFGTETTPAVKKKWQDKFIYTEKGGLIPANSNCKLFIGEDGTYGSYGRIISNYLADDVKNNGTSIFYSDAILGMESAPRICPNWGTLDQTTRLKFWVWTMAAIASAESSCNWDVKEAWGVNDVCSGLLQLEKGYKLRSRRGPNCSGVSPEDIKKPYSNLRCGMDVMRQQLVSPNATGEPVYDGRIYPAPGMKAQSYWQKLRIVNGSDIGRLIRAFKPCGA